ETYTARRAYQIAALFRQRGIPVIMGGFHATLVPEEVAQYADCCVIGEGERVWPQLCADLADGRLQRRYCSAVRPALTLQPDRRLLRGREYLPIRLVECSRGCRNHCTFCSIQSAYDSTRSQRPLEEVLCEVQALCREQAHPTVFFIDDHLNADRDWLLTLLRAITPLRLRWFGQVSLDCAQDDELMTWMRASGCATVLVGIENLDQRNLTAMRKPARQESDPARLLGGFHRHRIPVYGAFVFGFANDTAQSIDDTVAFAMAHGTSLAAFAHLTPFPGTPLYRQFAHEERLLHPQWWLDRSYGYGRVTFRPEQMSSVQLELCCARARRRFYAAGSILRRWRNPSNHSSWRMSGIYWLANLMHHADRRQRRMHPLGDERLPLLPGRPA
ncbi:MAG: B12-binding domain-containing radical SAM protein, partial [Planctomycetota bacterium]